MKESEKERELKFNALHDLCVCVGSFARRWIIGQLDLHETYNKLYIYIKVCAIMLACSTLTCKSSTNVDSDFISLATPKY